MLQLPIRNRTGVIQCSPDQEQAPSKAGRQLFIEALGGALDYGTDGEGSTGTKVTVKNTFIEVDTPDRVDVQRGSQTCSARLSEPSPTFHQSPVIPEASPAMPLDTPASTGSDLPSPEENGLSVGLRNTFIDVKPIQEDTPRVTQSCVARLCAPTPQNVPAPPAYPAPNVSMEENMSPPPAKCPSLAGRQVFLEALAFLDDHENEAKANADLKLVVKNTFIDVDERQAGNDGRPQTTTGRFINTWGSSMLSPVGDATIRSTAYTVYSAPSKVGSMTGSPFSSISGVSPITVVKSPAYVSFPSVGSQAHGQLLADGQPACQPCAWFYKESGCQNGVNCRYCHLCPQGEMKIRKKAKVQRMRQIQETATTATSPSTTAGTAPAAPFVTVAAPMVQVSHMAPVTNMQPTVAVRQPLMMQAQVMQPAAPAMMVAASMPYQAFPQVASAPAPAAARGTPLLLSALLSSQS